MKIVPVNKELKQLKIKPENHFGDFGILLENELSVYVNAPDLNIFNEKFDDGVVVCKDSISTSSVLNGKDTGYILYRLDKDVPEKIDMKLKHYSIYTHGDIIPCPGNMVDDSVYICSGNLKDLTVFDIDSLLKSFRSEKETIESKYFFYKNIYTQERIENNVIYGKNGLIRKDRILSYIDSIIDKKEHIKKFGGVVVDSNMKIVQESDRYIYYIYGEKKLITDFTMSLHSVDIKNNEVDITINVCKSCENKLLHLNNKEYRSIYLMRKEFVKYGFNWFTSSPNVVYAIFKEMIDKCTMKKTYIQPSFDF